LNIKKYLIFANWGYDEWMCIISAENKREAVNKGLTAIREYWELERTVELEYVITAISELKDPFIKFIGI
jgi:hypothetical protein